MLQLVDGQPVGGHPLRMLLALTLLVASCRGAAEVEIVPSTAPPAIVAGLWLPEEVDRTVLVVTVPGGAWRTADPSGLEPLAAELAAAGVAVATLAPRAADDGVR